MRVYNILITLFNHSAVVNLRTWVEYSTTESESKNFRERIKNYLRIASNNKC